MDLTQEVYKRNTRPPTDQSDYSICYNYILNFNVILGFVCVLITANKQHRFLCLQCPKRDLQAIISIEVDHSARPIAKGQPAWSVHTMVTHLKG